MLKCPNIQEIADDSAQKGRKLKVQDMESIRRAVEESDISLFIQIRLGRTSCTETQKLNFHTYLCMFVETIRVS